MFASGACGSGASPELRGLGVQSFPGVFHGQATRLCPLRLLWGPQQRAQRALQISKALHAGKMHVPKALLGRWAWETQPSACF